MSRHCRAFAFAVWLSFGSAGCGRADLDVLVPSNGDDCSDFTTESDCADHAAIGCSFQPNAEGCRMGDPSCAPGMCRSGDAFVRRRGRAFTLNGKPFRFVGVSSWAGLQPEGCASIPADQREMWVESIYEDLVPARAKVARFLAIQTAAGASGTDYTLFDAAVRGARRAGIRIQLVLGDQKGDCGATSEHDNAWYESGYQQPERNYALSYQDFALGVAAHFANEPTVLGYVLVHSFGAFEGADPGALSRFATEMGGRLHSTAPNQLLSLDYALHGGTPDDLTTYHDLESLSVADFVDVNDYTKKYPATPLDPTLLKAVQQIDKPAIIGEGAFWLLGIKEADLAARANAARIRMVEWQAAGFSGALFWAYDPGWTEISEEFDARPGDPMLEPGGVVASAPW